MEAAHPESDVNEPAEPKESTPNEGSPGPSDPAALVDRLIEAGEWPDPALLDQIVAAGEAALGPLLDFMRTYPSPKDYQREIVLYNGIGILGAIRSPATIPDLVEILKRYPADSGEQAAEVLGDFGPIAFEPALELIHDPAVSASSRRNAINAAKRAAGADPALRARLADVLRPLLDDALERTREYVKQHEQEPDEDDEENGESGGWVLEDVEDEGSFDDDEDFEDEDLEGLSDETGSAADEETPDDSTAGELEPYEELMFLISDLAELADPQARATINTAFQENLVETFWVDKKSIDESYRKGGEPPLPPLDWLEDYRDRYQQRIERLNRPAAPLRPLYQPSLAASYSDEPDEPEPMPRQEPVRNVGPKLGRNDPCWCGSGKKYKKCHWGKPGP